jgi:carboxyl-terminal processing protease
MKRLSLGVAFLVAGLLALPAVGMAAPDRDETYRQLNLFGDVFERVRSDYVEEVTDETLIEAAINGMLTSLDPHSSYLNVKNFAEMQIQTKGRFGGLGIEVTMENGLVKVISPIDDTPAAAAGLKTGDFITRLDNESVRGLTLGEAVERMRGPPNSDIRLTILRQGQDPFDLTITRAIIKIRSVRSRAEGEVGYIRITSFNEQTEKGVRSSIRRFRKKLGDKLQGIVLDLRNNPGGLLDQAVAVSDLFLDKGEIVSTRARRASDSQRFNARPGDIGEGLPMVVLINGGSASASEIVAGALQDHRQAIILGTASFGKGSVQTIIPINGHGAMRLTTSRYYTPSGASIQAKGIVPDIVVEQARVEKITEDGRQREADLRGALNREETGAVGEKKPLADGSTPAPDDYQLARALDLLRGVSLFSARAMN